jgi:hypothetical protein
VPRGPGNSERQVTTHPIAIRIQRWKSTAVDPKPSLNSARKLTARVVTGSFPVVGYGSTIRPD